ncbi:5'-AMP-activated_protein kinase [Hexamita inflata]|uniref:Beta subunit n=1 Tax=Hexamita inflata TaxID=28002 RepID=A0ABP1H6X4_9EUKA
MQIFQNDTIFVPIIFSWPDLNQEVFISGSFDNWESKIKLEKNLNNQQIELRLEPGNYQFKFIVNQQWVTSQDYNIVFDELGNENNAIDTTDQLQLFDRDFNTNIPTNLNLWNMYPTEMGAAVNQCQMLDTPLNTKINKQFLPHILLTIPKYPAQGHYYRQIRRRGYQAVGITINHRGKFVSTVFYQSLNDKRQQEIPELVDIFNKFV